VPCSKSASFNKFAWQNTEAQHKIDVARIVFFNMEIPCVRGFGVE